MVVLLFLLEDVSRSSVNRDIKKDPFNTHEQAKKTVKKNS